MKRGKRCVRQSQACLSLHVRLHPPWCKRFTFHPLSILFSLLGALLLVAPAYGQQPYFQRLAIESGLSESNVSCIEQDQEGYLWFGTQDGLNRYDGYTFIVYRQNALDSTSISNNFIQALVRDRTAGLWVGTGGGGLNWLDCKLKTFHRYQHHPDNPESIAGDVITCLIQDEKGTLWIGVDEHGLDRLVRGENTFKHFRHDRADPHSLSSDAVLALLEGNDGAIWVGTVEGLDRLDPASLEFTHYSVMDERHTLRGTGAVSALYQDREGRLWAGTADGRLGIVDSQQRTVVPFLPDEQQAAADDEQEITAIREDHDGVLWAGTNGGGLERIEPATRTRTPFRNNPRSPQSLSNDYVRSLFVDEAGILWIGTDGGINKIDKLANRFELVRYDPNDPNTLSAKSVTSFCEDRTGLLWIGTAGGGLNRFDRRIGTFTAYRHDLQAPTSLASNYVRVVHEDSAGILWVGTDGGGLDAFDRRQNVFRHYRHDPRTPGSLSNNVVLALFEDRAGVLWVATDGGGLCRFDRQTNRFTTYSHDPADPSSISDNSVASLLEDSQGRFWVGTCTGGLCSFDRATGRFVRYKNRPGDPTSLRHNFVRSLLEDARGRLWVGTFGGGLNLFDPASGKFSAYTVENGLPNDVIYGIEEDHNGDLWLSTNRGLACFSPSTATSRNYDAHDGLQSDEFNGGACYKDREGRCYFGGIRGYNVFKPEDIVLNKRVPPVVITDFRIFEKPVPRQLASGMVEVREADNFFGFEYAALSYTIPEKNQYAYMLEGFDEEWIQCGTRRYATYTSLDAGRYVFHVKASNNDGIWNEYGTSIVVIINPPFWKTWWFAMFLAGGFLIALGATIRYLELLRIQRKMQHLESQRSLDRERLRIAQDMHDEVGATLTEIAILGEILAKEINATGPAQVHVRKIAERSRRVVDNIGEIIWAINPKNDHIDSLAAYLRKYATQLFSDTGVRCDVEFPETFPDVLLSAESRRNIYLVVKEALHNVMKHASATKVCISLLYKRKHLEIRIVDNGRGFMSETLESSGNGLANMKRRMEHIGGRVDVWSKAGDGTSVVIGVDAGEATAVRRRAR